MPQSLVQIYLHIVFSTKYRRPYLADRRLRERTHAYLAGICREHGAPALRIGGIEDHVHILNRMSKVLAICDLVLALKRDSSKWVKRQVGGPSQFRWQLGYGAFSVSPRHAETLIWYIANQERHHHGETFQDEFRRVCRKYGVEIDERYVWE